MIEGGSATLYQRTKSTVVTQEFELPAAKQLHFWLAGGDLDDLIEAEQESLFLPRKGAQLDIKSSDWTTK